MKIIWQASLAIVTTLIVVACTVTSDKQSDDKGTIRLFNGATFKGYRVDPYTGKVIELDDDTVKSFELDLSDLFSGNHTLPNLPGYAYPGGVFCRVSENCTDLFPGEPVFCEVDSKKEICNKPGKLLPVEPKD